MKGFTIKTSAGKMIRFHFYFDEAPASCDAFYGLLPFTWTFMHARVSGQEIWADNAHTLDIIQENSSVFTEPGEVVLGPTKPLRSKTRNAIGIYYGEGRGLDGANIFAKVVDEDMQALQELGEQIWKGGVQQLLFEKS